MDKHKKKQKMELSKQERLQLKSMICILGMILLGLLFLGRMISVPPKQPEPSKAPHIPVVTVLTNVWIMEADSEHIVIFRDGDTETYYYEAEFEGAPAVREQLADICLTDGYITEVVIKQEKLSARLLGTDGFNIDLEGYGKIPLSPDYKGYRIYNTLAMCRAEELSFGYQFADYVVENGMICGILWVNEDAMETIRVLIKASDYAGLLHEKVILTSDTSFTMEYGAADMSVRESYPAGTEVSLGLDSGYFTADRIKITPDVLTGKIILKNVNRNNGTPAYRGIMEVIKTEAGIAVVNELPLEEYLYSVVPSEMPASYPEEALKAQAICARTYAYAHMQNAAFPEFGAHVDDSTSYQVYNNILEQERTTTAVKETYGKLLFTGEGELAGTYYYSTSCGIGSDANVWKTEAAKSIDYLSVKPINKTEIADYDEANKEHSGVSDGSDVMDENVTAELLRQEEKFRSFITLINEDDFESEEGWYRWSYSVEKPDTKRMLEVIQKRYQANEKLILTLKDNEFVSVPVEELEHLTEISITKRGIGGVADEMILKTKKNTYKIISEHNIRYVLCDGVTKVVRMDGSEVSATVLLPSAFIIVDTKVKKSIVTGYSLTGGGFGHGVGMSQNGAKNMAANGYTAEDILLFFYDNCMIHPIYE